MTAWHFSCPTVDRFLFWLVLVCFYVFHSVGIGHESWSGQIGMSIQHRSSPRSRDFWLELLKLTLIGLGKEGIDAERAQRDGIVFLALELGAGRSGRRRREWR